MKIKELIKSIENFPSSGISFKDITPLMGDGPAFSYCCQQFVNFAQEIEAEIVVCPEARGFIFGCPVAQCLGIGVVPVRKKGKLPRPTISADYSLEYGNDSLFMHHDAIKKGQRVIIIDDLLATGGTTRATAELVEKLGGIVAGIAVLIELEALDGRAQISQYRLFRLVSY